MGARDVQLAPVHYFVGAKNAHHGEAIAQGFGAKKVPMWRHGGYLHLIGGLQHGSLEVLQDVRRRGEPYIFFDRAYFGGGPGTDWLRATRNAYQQHWVEPRVKDADGGRARWLGVALKPWRRTGGHVMVVPPSAAIRRLFGLGDWEAHTLARLRRLTDRELRVSYKGDPEPLSRRLDSCWAAPP